MKTIGEILKNARVEKKFSLESLEKITKIKPTFITLVESESWDKLPAFPVVLGFVKSLSGALNLEEKVIVATLKRDYPPKKLTINPKPDISSKFVWGPKITFTLGVLAFLVLIFGYLGFQYYKFLSPPNLSVESPKEEQLVSGNSVLVFGNTDTDAKITVNNQPVLVSDDGNFSVNIGVVINTREVVIKAISRSGKERVVTKKIIVK